MSEYVGIYLTGRAMAVAEALAKTGLHGTSREEVVENIVYRGLQDAVASNTISALRPVLDERPRADDGATPCDACDSGMKLKLLESCDVCGRKNEMPF